MMFYDDDILNCGGGGEEEEDWSRSYDDNQGQSDLQIDETSPEKHFDKHEKVIVHIDIDCFYAQVEMICNPELRDKPLGIQQKNIIVTCNYVARDRGLTKLMYLKDAKEKCKDLVIVNGEDLTKYRDMSNKINELLTKYTPLVEKLGFDENFLDVTNMISCPPWCDMANEPLEGYVYESPINGITSCGGVGHNKTLAKLVGSTHKPNKQTLIYPGGEKDLMVGLGSIRKVPGIGHATAKRLAGVGVHSVSDLLAAPLPMLSKEIGAPSAKHVKQLAAGKDESAVVPTGKPQSMSDEDSFKRCDNIKDAKGKIKELTTSLLKRLLTDGRTPQVLRLTIRKFDPKRKYFGRESRQCGIAPTIFYSFSSDTVATVAVRLVDVAMGLFVKMVDPTQPFHFTLLNVCLTKFTDARPDKGTSSAIGSMFQKQMQKMEHSVTRKGDESIRSALVQPAGNYIGSMFKKQQEALLEKEVEYEIESASEKDDSMDCNISFEQTPRKKVVIDVVVKRDSENVRQDMNSVFKMCDIRNKRDSELLQDQKEMLKLDENSPQKAFLGTWGPENGLESPKGSDGASPSSVRSGKKREKQKNNANKSITNFFTKLPCKKEKSSDFVTTVYDLSTDSMGDENEHDEDKDSSVQVMKTESKSSIDCAFDSNKLPESNNNDRKRRANEPEISEESQKCKKRKNDHFEDAPVLPEGICAETFAQLPQDIQKELLAASTPSSPIKTRRQKTMKHNKDFEEASNSSFIIPCTKPDTSDMSTFHASEMVGMNDIGPKAEMISERKEVSECNVSVIEESDESPNISLMSSPDFMSPRKAKLSSCITDVENVNKLSDKIQEEIKDQGVPSTSEHLDISNWKQFQTDSSASFEGAQGISNVDTQEQAKGSDGNLDLPPHIDKAVYLQLPSDIQKSILKDWKAQKVQEEFKTMKSGKSPKSCSKSNARLGSNKNSSITSFFKKR